MATEKEAAARWCPFARPLNGGTRYKPSPDAVIFVGETACIGSRCMAWRWSEWPPTDGRPREGFCGLAGAPERGE